MEAGYKPEHGGTQKEIESTERYRKRAHYTTEIIDGNRHGMRAWRRVDERGQRQACK